MASVNPLSRELVFKIVYYGPGLGGKTTTLEYLHATAKPEHRGKLVSLATPVDRTLYFDFLPVRLPPVRGMNVRLQLFTVPGQVYFNATRKLVLTGADGLVFVSDSQPVRADANLESLENLRENLADQGRELAQLPLVFQHNKRDLEEVLPLEELDAMLNPFEAPALPTSAKTGLNIYESLEAISQQVLTSFAARMPEALGSLETHFEVPEGGLTSALRDASPRANGEASGAVIARLSPPQEQAWPSMPPNATLGDHEAAELEPMRDPHSRSLEPDHRRAPSSAPPPHPPAAPALTPAAAVAAAPPVARAPGEAGLSFAELWPEPERETVREVESALAGRRYARAIELCEALVSRVFASAAGLFGSADAPRDPVLVPMLLGLDGRRYLAFRTTVREARAGTLLGGHQALAAFAFAIDARLARNSV